MCWLIRSHDAVDFFFLLFSFIYVAFIDTNKKLIITLGCTIVFTLDASLESWENVHFGLQTRVVTFGGDFVSRR